MLHQQMQIAEYFLLYFTIILNTCDVFLRVCFVQYFSWCLNACVSVSFLCNYEQFQDQKLLEMNIPFICCNARLSWPQHVFLGTKISVVLGWIKLYQNAYPFLLFFFLGWGGIRCYYCHGFGFSIFFGGGQGDKMLLSWFWFQYFLFRSIGHTVYSIALFVWVGCRRGDLKVSCCGGGEGRKWDREMGVGGTQREVGWYLVD